MQVVMSECDVLMQVVMSACAVLMRVVMSACADISLPYLFALTYKFRPWTTTETVFYVRPSLPFVANECAFSTGFRAAELDDRFLRFRFAVAVALRLLKIYFFKFLP